MTVDVDATLSPSKLSNKSNSFYFALPLLCQKALLSAGLSADLVEPGKWEHHIFNASLSNDPPGTVGDRWVTRRGTGEVTRCWDCLDW